MDLELAGKRALVTGASAGIGQAIAQNLADEGVRVGLVARRADRLEQLAGEFEAAGAPQPVVLPADLTDADEVQRVAAAAPERLGGVDILVNCAGGSRPVPVQAGEDAWVEAMALNFEAVRRLTHACLDAMVERGWGRVVNITGTSEPLGFSAANPAKAAVHSWAKGLSRAVGRSGVTINSIAPGRINSEQILQRLHPTEENRQRYAEANIPVGYFGEPEDLAVLAVFLCSPKARYITGELLHVDGGMRRFSY